MSRPSPTATSARGFVSTLVVLAVLFVVTLVLQFGTPRSTSALWSRLAQTGSVLWHQDWRLFTRAPLEPDTVVYDARELSLITMPAASTDNRWGLSRIAYTQWMETVAVEALLPADRWRDCAAEVIGQCRPVLASMAAVTVANPTREATLCGRFVFARETPREWRDAEPATGGTRRIDAIALLDVTCGR